MEASDIKKFIDTCKASGIESYGFRHNGGSRDVMHGETMGVINLQGNICYCLERGMNPSAKEPFLVDSIPADDVMFMFAPDLSMKQAIDLLNGLGGYNKDMENFLKARGGKSHIMHGANSNAGIDVIKDKDGKVVAAPHSAGYVTK